MSWIRAYLLTKARISGVSPWFSPPCDTSARRLRPQAPNVRAIAPTNIARLCIESPRSVPAAVIAKIRSAQKAIA
ncbi:hypothetical protein GCM10007315_31930 [Gemmobacter tilapiae]|uniref:Uncharacterized protein n=1 Tax=Neogemmobacter tilapiae TaxID=875041 RepID=A0A918TW92_9RHOB|nr:hypothetical protein GCM10007315_31930 [Gemmobacter tilapiae]